MSRILHRVAVQGSPNTLTAVSGRWLRGSRLRDPGRHPFRIPFNELQLGASIHVRELALPPDVKALSDPDAIVVHVTVPQVEVEEGAEPTAGTAEPEIVGRRVAEEEAGAE